MSQASSISATSPSSAFINAPQQQPNAAAPPGYQYALVPSMPQNLPLVPYNPQSNRGVSRRTRRGNRGGGRNLPQQSSRNQGYALSGVGVQVARTGMLGVMPTTMGAAAPVMHKKPSTPGGLRLRGKELFWKFTNPNATGDFYCGYKGMTPVALPWLRSFAQNYEQFFFHYAQFTWQPAFASANGTVGMCVDTDFSDAVATQISDALKNQCSVAGLVCAPMACEYFGYMSLCQRHLIVQGGGQSSTSLMQGSIQVFTEGVGEQTAFGVKNGSPLGYVYMEYDVEFYVPQGGS